MSDRRQVTVLRVAALLAILGILFMVWAVLAPTPMPVVLAMTVGQAVGSLSFLLFLIVVISDLRKKKVFDE